jgi:phospholipid/cholesterol/gamma-HCH transport system permease protein
MHGWHSTEGANAHLKVERRDDGTTLAFAGLLDSVGAGVLWHDAMRAALRARTQSLTFDLAAVTGCDMVGASMLLAAEHTHGAPVTLLNASPRVIALLRRARPASEAAEHETVRRRRSVRHHCAAGMTAMGDGIAFLGEALVAVTRLPSQGRMLRIGDLLHYADQAGVRAIPLVMMLGFLMGMILAFQSAIPMRKFGADLFVVNLVTISLIRELGPLLAAVILAGRTGSAFAAEIGTMKVNQEVDALVTMGLDPMTMLVLPRLIAVMLVLPALALLLDIAGLAGMTAVMRGFGFPLPAILRQAQAAAAVSDLIGGLFKAICFGAAIAAIGCKAGLSTGHGPRAVGLSATAAVVGGIISTILLDGVLALVFYRLNL